MKDLTSDIYGDLIVLSKSKVRHKTTGEVLWNCKCRCGKLKQYRTSKLVTRKSCGECKPEERTNTFENERRDTKARKDKLRFSEVPLATQLKIINEYCFGKNTDVLSEEYNIAIRSLTDGITLYRERLNTMHELHYMTRASKTSLASEVIEKALATKTIEKDILEMLSDETSEELTLQEELYCYLYVYTGSNNIAIKESGFSDKIPKDTTIKRQLLGMFLREKPNLKAYIGLLKDARIAEVKSSKQIVQHELINQVEQLKESVAHRGAPSDRGHLLRAIELLGKTVGAFEDRVRVTEVNANEALDELLKMAKAEAAEIKEIPYDRESEHYEVDYDA